MKKRIQPKHAVIIIILAAVLAIAYIITVVWIDDSQTHSPTYKLPKEGKILY